MLKLYKIITFISFTACVVLSVLYLSVVNDWTDDTCYYHNMELYNRYVKDGDYIFEKIRFHKAYIEKYPNGKHLYSAVDDVFHLFRDEMLERIENIEREFPNTDDSLYYYKGISWKREGEKLITERPEYKCEIRFFYREYLELCPNTLLNSYINSFIYENLIKFRRIPAWNIYIESVSPNSRYYNLAIEKRDSLIQERIDANQEIWKTEEEAWEIASVARSGKLLESFIRHYPNSYHVIEARERLENIKNQVDSKPFTKITKIT